MTTPEPTPAERQGAVEALLSALSEIKATRLKVSLMLIRHGQREDLRELMASIDRAGQACLDGLIRLHGDVDDGWRVRH